MEESGMSNNNEMNVVNEKVNVEEQAEKIVDCSPSAPVENVKEDTGALSFTLDAKRINRNGINVSNRGRQAALFCYKGENYTIYVNKGTSPRELKNMILRELWRVNEIVYYSDIEIQADNFFQVKENGKTTLSIPEGNIIPVLAKECKHPEKESETIDIKNSKGLSNVIESIRQGELMSVKSLSIVMNANIRWRRMEDLLRYLFSYPFLHLTKLTLEAHRAISKSYLTRQVNRSRMPLLEEIVMNYHVNGDSYDLKNKLRQDKKDSAIVQEKKKQAKKEEEKKQEVKKQGKKQGKKSVEKKKEEEKPVEEKKEEEKPKRSGRKPKRSGRKPKAAETTPKEEEKPVVEEKKEAAPTPAPETPKDTPKETTPAPKKEEKKGKGKKKGKKAPKETAPKETAPKETTPEATPTAKETTPKETTSAPKKEEEKTEKKGKGKKQGKKPTEKKEKKETNESTATPATTSATKNPKKKTNRKPYHQRGRRNPVQGKRRIQSTPIQSQLNANAESFVPPGYFVPRNVIYPEVEFSPLNDASVEVDWEKDFARVDFTRRFSISEERPNPNETDATRTATVQFLTSNRRHRNINVNNIPTGKLPQMEQLIQDMALDQSHLLSIRINMPIDLKSLTRFMQAFIRANCKNINTLCLCQIDFTEVDCQLLKKFMECDNMRGLEVISFMKSKLSDEQLKVILTAIMEHHLDNLQDMNFEDVNFSMENLTLLHSIIHNQVLLKIWCIHLRNIMETFDPKKLELIKDIFNTINMGKML